jgi:predicted CXXCH cytochrome family protein
VPMDCMSCHDANAGTMYKHFLHGSAERGLCVQCHLSY